MLSPLALLRRAPAPVRVRVQSSAAKQHARTIDDLRTPALCCYPSVMEANAQAMLEQARRQSDENSAAVGVGEIPAEEDQELLGSMLGGDAAAAGSAAGGAAGGTFMASFLRKRAPSETVVAVDVAVDESAEPRTAQSSPLYLAGLGRGRLGVRRPP